jgi:hypothetical protein
LEVQSLLKKFNAFGTDNCDRSTGPEDQRPVFFQASPAAFKTQKSLISTFEHNKAADQSRS